MLRSSNCAPLEHALWALSGAALVFQSVLTFEIALINLLGIFCARLQTVRASVQWLLAYTRQAF